MRTRIWDSDGMVRLKYHSHLRGQHRSYRSIKQLILDSSLSWVMTIATISIALILQFLVRVGQDIQVRALPILAISPRLIESSCDGQSNCRTSWDIVCSCALVIFSCTWVALHPNIPSPDDTSWDITFRRAVLMLALIIAPELAVALSLRQWIAARTLAKKFKESGVVSHFCLLNCKSVVNYPLYFTRLDKSSRILWRYGRLLAIWR